ASPCWPGTAASTARRVSRSSMVWMRALLLRPQCSVNLTVDRSSRCPHSGQGRGRWPCWRPDLPTAAGHASTHVSVTLWPPGGGHRPPCPIGQRWANTTPQKVRQAIVRAKQVIAADVPGGLSDPDDRQAGVDVRLGGQHVRAVLGAHHYRYRTSGH